MIFLKLYSKTFYILNFQDFFCMVRYSQNQEFTGGYKGMVQERVLSKRINLKKTGRFNSPSPIKTKVNELEVYFRLTCFIQPNSMMVLALFHIQLNIRHFEQKFLSNSEAASIIHYVRRSVRPSLMVSILGSHSISAST